MGPAILDIRHQVEGQERGAIRTAKALHAERLRRRVIRGDHRAVGIGKVRRQAHPIVAIQATAVVDHTNQIGRLPGQSGSGTAHQACPQGDHSDSSAARQRRLDRMTLFTTLPRSLAHTPQTWQAVNLHRRLLGGGQPAAVPRSSGSAHSCRRVSSAHSSPQQVPHHQVEQSRRCRGGAVSSGCCLGSTQAS